MNFKMGKGNNDRKDPVIDFKKLAADLDETTPEGLSHLRYAPAAVRNAPAFDDRAVGLIKSFGELPAREIDEIVAAAEAEIANLKREAQSMRDRHMADIERLQANVERLRQGVRLTMETFSGLREQVAKLDNPEEEPPKDAA